MNQNYFEYIPEYNLIRKDDVLYCCILEYHDRKELGRIQLRKSGKDDKSWIPIAATEWVSKEEMKSISGKYKIEDKKHQIGRNHFKYSFDVQMIYDYFEIDNEEKQTFKPKENGNEIK